MRIKSIGLAREISKAATFDTYNFSQNWEKRESQEEEQEKLSDQL